jgi:hypothetical protein
LKPQDQGREIAKKYMKKVGNTVSNKVARAKEKRAKKRAKFDGSEPAKSTGEEDDEDDEDAEDSENDEEMSDDDDAEVDEAVSKRGRAPHGTAAGASGGRGGQLKPTHRASSRAELQELMAKKMQQFAGSRPKVKFFLPLT